MAADSDGPAPRPASLGAAIRGSVTLTLEWAVPLVATNLAWGIAMTAFLVLLVGLPVLALAAPLLAIPTSALMRLAVAAVRAGVPTLPMAWAELGRLPLRKVALGLVQLLVLGIALTNLDLAARMGGVLGLLSGGVALYAAVVGAILAVAVWPIVCDPLREGSLRGQVRLALAVAIRRPVQLAVLALIVGLAAYVSIQLLVPALFLPTVVLLAVAGYVVPAADELAPPPATA